jgi:hypothetical protein
MGTLFFRQRCLESRIGGKCIYCTATKLNVRDNQDNNRRGYGLPSIKQAQFASKNGDTRLVKIGHGVVGLLLEQRCAKGMLSAWHRW